ncbi:membrane protease FtsH catalytic subunit [Hydrogenispora ethanolica]|uniref:ATP-dependent zinc metalloprotease FtsH n=1 Tax=Hydrogenispora ethanolica TaxID=1082276 RepID=A0A4R1RXY7_HYDET|nr:ATP-dependent zinc metalloprotease FtsH [Hydrogenispora ethanolica]TCL71608.1 membrane protease FtsH catalytic subunit [Hydrogenispora ethanolica]
MLKIAREILLYFLVAILVLVFVARFMKIDNPVDNLNFDQFIKRVEAGKIIDAKVNNNDGTIDGEQKDFPKTKYHVEGPVNHPELYYDLLRSKGVKLSFSNPGNGWWAFILPNLGMIVIFIIFWFFLLNQMQNTGNKALSFGKSRARLHTEDKNKTTFDDVAGEDEAKEELQEIVEFLKQPRRFTELGAKIPKGVLLIGHPGTGKTLLAKAVAGEAGVPFFSISGSDFVEMFVGVGASRVRDLFDQAKKNAPCIVFVDEIDAVGRQRGAGLGGGHDEREQTLNQLLVEMDGFEPNSGIIMLAATNRPDVLDPALLRPGRFDRQVTLDIPDIKGREDILKVHARGKPLAPEVDLTVLARQTPGFTGADLANVLNEAALLAARRGKKKVYMEDCEDAIERVIAGPEKKSRIMSAKEKDLTAFHEAGHALVGHYLPTVDPIHKVSIIPRGQAGGYTLALPLEDKHYNTRTELLENVVFALGGRAAEVIALGEISTGARSDLERSTKIVRKMVTEYGMSEELGYMTFGHGHEETVFLGRDISRDKNYSEEIAAAIDREIKKIMDESFERAKDIIIEHRDALDRIAQALMEKETIEGPEFLAVLEKKAGDEPPAVPETVPAEPTEA